MGADQHFDLRDHIASTLGWWRDAGVDVVIDDTPRDWLAAAIAPPAALAAVVAEPILPAWPDTLAEFVAWRMGDEAIERRWGGVPIAPQGRLDARVHVVVDMPDGEAEWFIGAASALFDRMLAAIGLDRSSICLSGLAWSRPGGGGLDPDVEGDLVAASLHLLALARPERVLLLGQTTKRALLGMEAARNGGRLHGINHGGARLEIVASWHPRFLLERPAAKADAWKDLQLLIRGMSQ